MMHNAASSYTDIHIIHTSIDIILHCSFNETVYSELVLTQKSLTLFIPMLFFSFIISCAMLSEPYAYYSYCLSVRLFFV